MRIASLGITFGVVSLIARSAPTTHADVIRDTISDGHWNQATGFDRVWDIHDPRFKFSVGIPAPGNGERMAWLEYIASFDLGDGTPNNFPDAGETTIRIGWFNDTADYASDPFALNRPNGWFNEFDTAAIANADWQTVVGHDGVHNLYKIVLDLRSLNWTTNPGQVHVISLRMTVNG
jgi:hypothetical protein